MWDFTKIPNEHWDEFKELYNRRDIINIILFHNRYNLSDYEYCCNKGSVLKWAKYGIEWKENKEKV